MPALIRNLLILLVAATLAIPTICDEGGENNGGGGVWILPCMANVTPVTAEASVAARATMVFPNTGSDVKMRTASFSSVTATFVDDLSGVPVSLAVSGRVVTLPKGLLQALAASTKKQATIVVSDAQQMGYVMRVLIQNDGSVRINVL